MIAPTTMLLIATFLAGMIAGSTSASAAVPGPLGEEVQTGRPPLAPAPECGEPGARFTLNANWNDGYFDLVLERFDAPGPAVIVATRRVSSAGGPAFLVCGDDGAGVVLFGDGVNYDDDYRVTGWNLQWFDADGSWRGLPRPLEAFPGCSYPRVLFLDADGDILGLESCRLTEGISIPMLRRFPADGGIEPDPVPLSDPTVAWINEFATATDDLGNRLVAWTEGFNEDDDGQLDWRIMARVLDAGRVALGEPFRVDTFDPAQAWLSRVVLEDDGLFSVYWTNRLAGGTIARTISVDADLFPFTPTTTTTLPPSAAAPLFDRVRSVGQIGAPQVSGPLAEGSLLSMNGDGHGALMLRRWMHRTEHYNYDHDDLLPRTSGYSTVDGGVRWTRNEAPPSISLFYDNPPWDAVSPNGTMVTAEVITQQVFPEESSWYVGRLVSRRSIDQGKTWTEAAVIEDDIYGGDYYLHDAALTTDGRGNWLAAWLSSDGIRNGYAEGWKTRLDVAFSHDDARTWTDAVGAWESITLVDCCSDEAEVRHTVTAASGADGSWGLAWRSEKRGTVWTARAADATSGWEVTQVRAPHERPPEVGLGHWYDAAAPYSRAAFVSAGSGVRVVAWEEKHAPEEYGDDGDIFFVRSADDGRTWSEAAPLNAYARIDGARDLEPALAADGSGRILAVWVTHDPLGAGMGMDSDIVSSISLDDGLTWSPPAAIDPAAVGDGRQDLGPIAASSGDNRWTVAWTALPYSSRWYWDQAEAVVKVAIAGATCGDGIVDDGEDCDDGNDDDRDGCNSNCTLPGCGNEVLEDGEVCEYNDPATGFGCTSLCEHVVCGDGERDVWTERCDDGNDSDNDDCPTTCRHARCGDGFVDESEGSWEECDDGNDTDDDACTNSCKAAYCGDGIILEGVETCDDWDGWGGNACTDLCQPAYCGDGRVWVGVEQCDDPTGEIYNGNCSADCKFIEPCGDADASGTVTAGDALTILRDAVDLGDVCTPDRCDVNGSGSTTAIDASAALRISSGLAVALNCPMQGTASFFLDESAMLGALQFEVDYSGASIGFGKGDGKAACESSLQRVMRVDALRPPGVMVMGFISFTGFRGPVELARCFVYSRRGDPAASSAFKIEVVEATDINGNPLDPFPTIRLVAR